MKGREAERVITGTVCGGRINLSEGDKKRNGFISDATTPEPSPHPPPAGPSLAPGNTLHAAPPWTKNCLFCSLCVLTPDSREQQWRRRSSYDFTVVRSLVFSSTFSRGEGLAGRLI